MGICHSNGAWLVITATLVISLCDDGYDSLCTLCVILYLSVQSPVPNVVYDKVSPCVRVALDLNKDHTQGRIETP